MRLVSILFAPAQYKTEYLEVPLRNIRENRFPDKEGTVFPFFSEDGLLAAIRLTHIPMRNAAGTAFRSAMSGTGTEPRKYPAKLPFAVEHHGFGIVYEKHHGILDVKFPHGFPQFYETLPGPCASFR